MKSKKQSDQKFYLSACCVALTAGAGPLLAQPNSTNNPASSTNATTLETVTVLGHLNEARSQILPNLGATAYSITPQSIENMAQGDNAGFNQVILRAPGVAEDSLGQLHIRGEHANLQYRIDDVVLPEGITGFGQELDPKFVQSMQLITGSLPAEYGFRTAGIIDIQTKGNMPTNSGSIELYGGSYDTIRPSFEFTGAQGKWTYFIDGSYMHDDIGIENPAPTSVPVHDYTDQYRTFLYASYLIDASSRLVLMGSADYATFQIPINPALQPVSTQPSGTPWVSGPFTPFDLNDNQTEQNYYGVLAYQKSAGDLNYQISAFGRNSGAHYTPDALDPTLYYNGGVATDENRVLTSGGVQGDGSYALGDKHTLRGGIEVVEEAVTADTLTTVFPVDGSGDVSGPQETIPQNGLTHALFAGAYIQDEWKIVPQLTLNAGVRFDTYTSTTDDENQASPRANLIYKPFEGTTLHVGYSRYFTPPPLETVPAANIAAFNGTSGASGVTTGTTVKAERANYYDVGISQKILPGLSVGLDGYYKTAQNQLDDGFFGQSLILSSFNYAEGRVEGLEFTVSYETNGFSTYANIALSSAEGKGAESAQFLWPDQAVVNYVNQHWIYLDHDQRVTGSFGAAYTFKEGTRSATRFYVDALYGSGLRQDGALIPGTTDPTPNGSSVGAYYSLNMGVEQSWKLPKRQLLKARLDVVNITDNVYPLRTGTGVGVNAAQYGERRGLFGSLSYAF